MANTNIIYTYIIDVYNTWNAITHKMPTGLFNFFKKPKTAMCVFDIDYVNINFSFYVRGII